MDNRACTRFARTLKQRTCMMNIWGEIHNCRKTWDDWLCYTTL
jgi:hypothetical protein